MKVNLIGMILNNAGRRCFDGLVSDDNAKALPAADSLHTLIMEYAKVVNGGKSDLVVASREVLVPSAPQPCDHRWRGVDSMFSNERVEDVVCTASGVRGERTTETGAVYWPAT